MQYKSIKKIILLAVAVPFLLAGFLAYAYLETAERKFVIAFGADADQNKPQPIWETILGFSPDAFLFLGDNAYIDSGNENTMREKYAKLGSMPGYIKLLERNIPIMATWDDHDYGKDDAGGDFPQKKVSQKVFLDFFREPKDSMRRVREGIYDARLFIVSGRRVQVIVLDTRYFRSPLKKNARAEYVADDDPHATILGEEQWKWLEEELARPADVRVIMSSIQLISREHGYEKWMNFPIERERLFKLIRKTKASGVIVVSGDRHFAELSAMNPGIGYPLYELTAGSLNKAVKKMPLEKNMYRNRDRSASESFGLITMYFSPIKTPRITLESKDIDGTTTIQRSIFLSELQQGILPLNERQDDKNP